MIKTDEAALICDLAETYHIYDYRQLPVNQVAVFCVGLRENSRIKMAMSGQKVPMETLLLASIADRLSILAWQNTTDGHKGCNVPKSFVNALTEEPKSREESSFKTSEDFESVRARILREMEVTNGDGVR